MAMTNEEISKKVIEEQAACKEELRQAMVQSGLGLGGTTTITGALSGTTGTTGTGSKYKTNLHWMEQQALELWGYAHMPTEGVVWQNIYKADGSIVAVRGHNGYSLSGIEGSKWTFCAGREIEFQFADETVRDDNNRHPSGGQPFPLWLQRERDIMEKRARRWRFWRR